MMRRGILRGQRIRIELCMVQPLRRLAASIKREVQVCRAIARHPRTPRLAKIALGLAIGYLLLPFDLIPDFLPVIGHLDDVIIIPALVGFALWLVPADVVVECRRRIARRCGCGVSQSNGFHVGSGLPSLSTPERTSRRPVL
jgi:uncharacterized membrane protein YkvA (DUF1232 family)